MREKKQPKMIEKNVENLCFDYDEYFPLLLLTKKKIGETPLKFCCFCFRFWFGLCKCAQQKKGVIMFFSVFSVVVVVIRILQHHWKENSFEFRNVAPKNQRPTRAICLTFR